MILVAGIEMGDPAPQTCWALSSVDNAIESVLSVRGDSLLVCTPNTKARPSIMTREVIARENLALVVLYGPITRQALVLRALSMLPPTSYGLAQHIANVVSSSCWTKVALSSVTKLSQARPGLGQHLRSLFPGASFDVDLNSGEVRSSSPISWNTNGAKAICWTAGASKSSMKVSLAGNQPNVVIAPGRISPYGARRWTELSFASDLRASIGSALSSVQATSCRSCGRTIAISGCPFCGTSILPNPHTVLVRR